MRTRIESSKLFLKEVDIPTIPETLLKLEKIYQSKFINRSDVEEVIKSDSTISGEIIKAVNSKQFKFPYKVESISQAIEIIGIENPSFLNIIKGASIKSLFSGSKKHQNAKEVFEYCIDVAQLSFEIADITGHDKHQAYTAGLFLDIGYLIMSLKKSSYIEGYRSSLSNPNKALENEILSGADHTTVGYIIAEHWLLPEWMRYSIVFHHERMDKITRTKLDIKTIDTIAIVKIATYLIAEISFGCYLSKSLKEQKEYAQWHLGLTDESIDQIRRTFIVDSLSTHVA